MTLFYYNNMPFELNKRVFYVLSFFTSVQFSCSVVSDSLQPHGPQHAKASLPITNSWSLLKLMSIELVMPSNHLILCRPLLSRLQFFPASGSYQMSQFFTSGGQSIGVSATASVLPMNIQDWVIIIQYAILLIIGMLNI